MLRAISFLVSAFLLFNSCGYHWTSESPIPTVAVSYAHGDETGALTAEVIRALVDSGLVTITSNDAQLQLELVVLSDRNETIGFRRDPQEIRGKIQKNLLASEGRRIMEVKATFRCKRSGEIVWGPYQLTAEADYDYTDGDSIRDLAFTNVSGVSVTVLPFSLGQLEPIETAQEAATHHLYTTLAKKLVDVISPKMVQEAP